MVADCDLTIDVLKEITRNTWEAPTCAGRRSRRPDHAVCQPAACSVARSTVGDPSRLAVRTPPPWPRYAAWRSSPRDGYRRIRIFLSREGHVMSPDRTHRLWHQAGVQCRGTARPPIWTPGRRNPPARPRTPEAEIRSTKFRVTVRGWRSYTGVVCGVEWPARVRALLQSFPMGLRHLRHVITGGEALHLGIPVAHAIGLVAEGQTLDEIPGFYLELDAHDGREGLLVAAGATRERNVPLTG